MSLRLSFIGMSNIGKTRWARRMAGMSFDHIDCDALIGRKLADQLGEHTSTGDMAQWMGLPYAPQYPVNSALYVEAEQQVMREALSRLARDPKTPFVVDTTGSLIYTSPDILRELRAKTRIVYFEASEAHLDALFKRYIQHPKPTIWNNLFTQQDGETVHQALRRCYPILLQTRASLYQRLAHITIPYEKHRASDADIAALIRAPVS